MEKGKIRIMKVLLDTNILIDYIAERKPFFQDAQSIILACCHGKLEGCIAAHSICNIFYILRSQMPEEERRNTLLWFCEILTVVGIDDVKLKSALKQAEFHDMEDCLQSKCAEAYSADYIVTRNIKDFAESSIPAIEPKKLLLMI